MCDTYIAVYIHTAGLRGKVAANFGLALNSFLFGSSPHPSHSLIVRGLYPLTWSGDLFTHGLTYMRASMPA